MTRAGEPGWSRPHLTPGGYPPRLFYKVHGQLDGTLTLSRSRHRTGGVPAGLTLQRYDRHEHPSVLQFGVNDPTLSTSLLACGPATTSAVESAPRAAILRGSPASSDTLDYLREAVGVVQALLDSGDSAVFDPLQLRWWRADAWRTRLVDVDVPSPREHVIVLFSDNGDGSQWLHTRGMVKFGRPDISVRRVAPTHRDAVIDLCNRLIDFQGFVGVVPDGETIRMAGLPGWTCRTLGDFDDPDFNNLRIEIG